MKQTQVQPSVDHQWYLISKMFPSDQQLDGQLEDFHRMAVVWQLVDISKRSQAKFNYPLLFPIKLSKLVKKKKKKKKIFSDEKIWVFAYKYLLCGVALYRSIGMHEWASESRHLNRASKSTGPVRLIVTTHFCSRSITAYAAEPNSIVGCCCWLLSRDKDVCSLSINLRLPTPLYICFVIYIIRIIFKGKEKKLVFLFCIYIYKPLEVCQVDWQIKIYHR